MSDNTQNDELKELLLLYPDRVVALLDKEHHHSLVRISRNLTNDEKASEDIVQEAFSYLWENRERLASDKNIFLIAHLTTVVKNRSVNYYKRSVWLMGKQVRPVNGLGVNINEVRDPDPVFPKEELPIWKIIDKFPKQERTVLDMRFRQNMSNKEIAAELKISVKGVENRMISAYRRLRQYEPDELRKMSFES